MSGVVGAIASTRSRRWKLRTHLSL